MKPGIRVVFYWRRRGKITFGQFEKNTLCSRYSAMLDEMGINPELLFTFQKKAIHLVFWYGAQSAASACSSFAWLQTRILGNPFEKRATSFCDLLLRKFAVELASCR